MLARTDLSIRQLDRRTEARPTGDSEQFLPALGLPDSTCLWHSATTRPVILACQNVEGRSEVGSRQERGQPKAVQLDGPASLRCWIPAPTSSGNGRLALISSSNMNAAVHTSIRVHRRRDDVHGSSAICLTSPSGGSCLPAIASVTTAPRSPHLPPRRRRLLDEHLKNVWRLAGGSGSLRAWRSSRR